MQTRNKGEGFHLADVAGREVDSRATSAVENLLHEFNCAPHMFYKEQTLQCRLYHRLVASGFDHVLQAAAGYKIHQVQKDYPPILPDDDGPRGRYDLVVFDQKSADRISAWNHRRGDEPVAPVVAFEVKFLKGLTVRPENARLDDLGKELRRLDSTENGVRFPHCLYMFRYAFRETASFQKIEQSFIERAKRVPRVTSWIAGVRFDSSREYRPDRWSNVVIRGGVESKESGSCS
jgi:hypothetical protein